MTLTGSASSETIRFVEPSFSELANPLFRVLTKSVYIKQEYYLCRKPERVFNNCVFEKLVCFSSFPSSARIEADRVPFCSLCSFAISSLPFPLLSSCLASSSHLDSLNPSHSPLSIANFRSHRNSRKIFPAHQQINLKSTKRVGQSTVRFKSSRRSKPFHSRQTTHQNPSHPFASLPSLFSFSFRYIVFSFVLFFLGSGSVDQRGVPSRRGVNERSIKDLFATQTLRLALVQSFRGCLLALT